MKHHRNISMIINEIYVRMLKAMHLYTSLQILLIFTNYILYCDTHLSTGSSALVSTSAKIRGSTLDKPKTGLGRSRKIGNDDDLEGDSKSKFNESSVFFNVLETCHLFEE